MGWESSMDEAKKGHRPLLKDWSRDRFATDRAADFEALAARFQKDGSSRSQVAVENSASMTPEEFVTKYEATNTPVLIKGVVDEEEWPASRRWTLQRLKEDFRDRKFKCGEDDDGYTIRVTMRNFVKYIENQVDDSPLYIFDSTFDDDFSAQRLLDDYKVPKYFPSNPDQEYRFGHTRSSSSSEKKQASSAPSGSAASGGGGGGSSGPEIDRAKSSRCGSSTHSSFAKQMTPTTGRGVGYHDLFSLVGERRRPPYRWILLGPKRSGTCVHTDPLATSAWNTSVHGRKLWVLFPPGTPKSIVKAKKVIREGEDDEAINYFVDLLPRLAKAHPTLDMYQFIAEAGDTVFVPGGWWHAVLNLDDTIAVTQNFCSKQNFERVWRETRTGRKKMAIKWLRKLREFHPDLAATAERLNAEDGFTMPFDKQIPVDADSRQGEAQRDEGDVERGRKAKKEEKRGKKGSSRRSKSCGDHDPTFLSASSSSVVHEKNADGRRKHVSLLDASVVHSGSLSGVGGAVGATPEETADSRGGEKNLDGSDESYAASKRSSGGSGGEDDDCVDESGQKRKIDSVAGALAEMMSADVESRNRSEGNELVL